MSIDNEKIDITVENLGVFFMLYHQQHITLKETIISFLRRKRRYEKFWALRNITFKVKKGEMLGIIGVNGSGKSTLLKILAKILIPDEGKATIRGKVSALLELGAGFHEELTGMENVYLAGSILGLTRKQIEGIYDEIVEFSELKKFMDIPVKNFSSGMYMRLGFTIATSVNPDILIIDEILGVGDEGFQKKCYERIENFKKAGKTIILVSHASNLVENFCDRAILLNAGQMVCDGKPQDIIATYREILSGRR
ncbi:MAG: hypothetical protein A3C43_06330 [Candidatus Schekmanbacteria bacterium RIFCSPHIGHO2_02_FULL_38_11]|uniref:ABC transporter domain-containing protein n=1 Tax=Candidatus Schekmanbacteria bacterium RIFCSPLOWO2_12_FULL_38_15 TaxID=1817883 RepID=A0A1F7SDM9_9BACT|nr:MAG: hypothetical protein A2043_01775 [Candidatus Schekmanbacteria bacterium GWA2_38_9]OGL48354.1 MAG: hypothetical protein A3H37_05115 [Candidatus Schekmanbacteria bacterium RIFCSPLOWO2_02_FULL_38_14]OGL48490.1 MAG: hypothetical protein A3C43_06330 [Candidatus Schekmanbacteria bacterium RIFCSPHIGHO2_02_FULL_38_11]OGL51880.1 MAG: hypothetical protein A3G31_05720 [Candidatus Schekmanbacteria bacterium RIFCSPLOWO2_12_FULL_38_15]